MIRTHMWQKIMSFQWYYNTGISNSQKDNDTAAKWQGNPSWRAAQGFS